MWTVNQAAKMTGVSIRTLHHYDAIGLLKPCSVTDAGYRLYDETSLARLGQIMLLKELGFSLKEIGEILDDPQYNREKALEEQIELLSLKKQRIETIISFAEQMKQTGGYPMDFKAFSQEKIKKYAEDAKKKWGDTDAYREYSEKNAGVSDEKQKLLAAALMDIFREFGTMRNRAPGDRAVQEQVKKLQNFITEHYYTCTKQILSGLGQMYAAGGEMTENIDAAGGNGTAVFAAEAIAEYCK